MHYGQVEIISELQNLFNIQNSTLVYYKISIIEEKLMWSSWEAEKNWTKLNSFMIKKSHQHLAKYAQKRTFLI